MLPTSDLHDLEASLNGLKLADNASSSAILSANPPRPGWLDSNQPPLTPLVTDAQLNSAPDDFIRAALIALCLHDVDVHERMTDVFHFAGAAVQNTKKLEGLRVCIMCHKPYLVSENEGKVCCHHDSRDASVNKDSKAWYQWEKNGRGAMDTPRNRKTMPEGFIYDCCRKDLASEGCTWGKHCADVFEYYADHFHPHQNQSCGPFEDDDDL